MEYEQAQEQQFGDFFDSCLPQTARFFLDRYRDVPSGTRDPLDVYVVEHFPFFRYLVNSYYDSRRTERLQLRALADADRLENLDALLADYLQTGLDEIYSAAKDLYMFILERFVVSSTVLQARHESGDVR